MSVLFSARKGGPLASCVTLQPPASCGWLMQTDQGSIASSLRLPPTASSKPSECVLFSIQIP